MRFTRRFWPILFLGSLLVILCLYLVIRWSTASALTAYAAGETKAYAERIAHAISKSYPKLALYTPKRLKKFTNTFAAALDVRVKLIRSDGSVLADSSGDSAYPAQLQERTHIATAFTQGSAVELRTELLSGQQFAIAAMLVERSTPPMVVQITAPVNTYEPLIKQINNSLLWAFGLALFVVAALTGYVARRISLNLASFDHQANGNSARLDIEEFVEAVTKTKAAFTHLRTELTAAVDKRDQLSAVIESMVEGVIAVDQEANILIINKAAQILFHVSEERAHGAPVQEIIASAEVHRYIRSTIETQEPMKGDIILHRGEQRILQADTTVLRSSENTCIGVLLVLDDITRLRRLEKVRTDFVANVSHELRTPITSIKGFIETLLDGAMHNKDELEQFLTIIERQSDRLNSIISDLLSLSYLEQDTHRESIELAPLSVELLLSSAIDMCNGRAEKKNISLSTEGNTETTVCANAHLMEQALVNLIDNAIKYSTPDSCVRISVTSDEQSVTFSVQDEGRGIEPQHLPRIFERFYRVDKARSRKLGGTGLGLAIVKHIAQVHNGSVNVESEIGAGSVFSITIPHVSPRDDTVSE